MGGPDHPGAVPLLGVTPSRTASRRYGTHDDLVDRNRGIFTNPLSHYRASRKQGRQGRCGYTLPAPTCNHEPAEPAEPAERIERVERIEQAELLKLACAHRVRGRKRRYFAAGSTSVTAAFS